MLIAREERLVLGGDGVDVWRPDGRRGTDLGFLSASEQLRHDEPGTWTACARRNSVERFQPLSGFCWVDIGELLREIIGHIASSLACKSGEGKLLPLFLIVKRVSFCHACPVSLFDPDDFAVETGKDPDGAMAATERSGTSTVVYTDGACSGNPGPGGWGWVIPGGAWASGAEDPSTNQRMEVQAALHAVTSLDGPLEIYSDSTYVVNCFRDEWWVGWERRGWRNSQKKPVANQDLWKPLIAAVKGRDVSFHWVKGHSGDEWNDIADELAVEAAQGRGSNGKVIHG